MTKIEELIKKKDDAILDMALESKTLKTIALKYPDAEYGQDRWHRTYIYSPSVNAVADRFYVTRSCGCCYDSAVLLYVYKEFGEEKIFTHNGTDYNSFNFMIGEGCFCGADRPNNGWEIVLRQAGISETIIEGIKKHFEDHPCTCGQDDGYDSETAGYE